MKYNKFHFILSLILLLVPGFIFAQTIRNVAYFPIPYVGHKTFTAKTAHLCSIDNPSNCMVYGALTTTNIKAERDIELLAGASSDSNAYVGSLYNNPDTTTGSFIVNAASNNKITISNLISVRQINADNDLKVKSIKWQSGSNSNVVFPSTLTSSLCWLPLRILGTYEYKYYLVKCP